MKSLPVLFARQGLLFKSILKEILSLKSGYNRSKGKFKLQRYHNGWIWMKWEKLTTSLFFYTDLSLVIRICGRRSMRRYNRPANDTGRSQAWRGSLPFLLTLNHPCRLHHRQQLSYYSINIPVTPIHRASYAFTGWLQSISSLGIKSPYHASLRNQRHISCRHLLNTR